VLSVSENLVHQVRYESLLKDNEDTMKEVNAFMGKRKMGKVLRRGSVAILKKVEDMMTGATKSTGAKQAAVLSYQFQNLTRGESFRLQQFEKWRTQMDDDDIFLIESVAHEIMTRLGYKPQIVGVTSDAMVFTDENIAEFKVLNEEGIKKMNADLAVENPEDLQRRLAQKAVLEQEAVLLSKEDPDKDNDIDEENEDEDDDKIKSSYPYKWPKGASKVGYLSTEEVKERLQIKEGLAFNTGGFQINYSIAMQRGYYPSDLDKPCQDSFLDGNFNGVHWLCVFDGHGSTGHDCANYAQENIIKSYKETSASKSTLEKALLDINKSLHKSEIDDSNSGTTALTVLIEDGNLLIANVGDCRCVIISSIDGKLSARALTQDQTPHRDDELKRIKKAGGLVMTSEQYDGEEAMHERWMNGPSPPRIWQSNRQLGKFPGCAFTRSIGDKLGEDIGVTADPEFTKYSLTSEDQIIIIGSDGIFEFISDIEAAVISSIYKNPTEACRALVGESYKRWIESDERTDDITVIMGFIIQG
jgi:serine/threonine protein phosphatase PrpC